MKYIQKTIILGGRGKMAKFLLPFLPSPITLIDIKDFDKVASKYSPSSKAVRRKSSSELSAASKNRPNSNLVTLFIFSVPAKVYDDTMQLKGKNRLASLIGTSGRGHRFTLFVHQTSVHSTPAQLLEPVTGVVLGMHLLHGSTVTDLSKQTAIITASPHKKQHHQYAAGHEMLNKFLRKQMGYGHVFQMKPDRHDTIMSNIQFLTHSMFLILADAIIDSGFQITDTKYLELPKDLLIIAGRMFKQEAHVYGGIATSNPFNRVIINQLKEIGDCSSKSVDHWLCSAILSFASIRDRIIAETKMTAKEVEKISTPMSRVRDGLINYALNVKPKPTGNTDLSLKTHTDKYVASVKSDYDTYFRDLGIKVKKELEKLDFEKIAMLRYQRLK